MKTENTITMTQASIGSVSHGTLKTNDLLDTFISEIEWQVSRNGAYLNSPENFALRDRCANVLGAAQDCFGDDGEILPDKESEASELVNETIPDLLQEFAKPYCYFGTHPGDGSDFGFWPGDIEQIKEQVGVYSSGKQEYPDDDYQGEWLHINERGNCTLYVREQTLNGAKDWEVWGIV